MLMTLKTSPLFRFLTQERFGHHLVTSPTHIKGGELWCLRATIIPTMAASMLSSKICCRKVSLYLLPSLYNFHNLTRCRLSNFFSVNPPVQQRREVGWRQDGGGQRWKWRRNEEQAKVAENCGNDRRIRREAAVDRQARMLEVRKHDYLQLDPSFITFTHVFQGFRSAFCSWKHLYQR